MAVITREDIIKPENLVYKRTPLLVDCALSYCPGCGHGTAHRMLMEVIEEMGIQSKTIGVAPVGCSVLAYEFLDIDVQQAAHGRAPALATAIKRLMPEKYVFTYQGDGDLAAIGTAETIHACNRGENFVIIFINNGIYGMTGGQAGPTTIMGQVTTTSPKGRNQENYGFPIKIAEQIALCDGTAYSTRVSLDSIANIRKTKAAIKKAFEIQQQGLGFSLVEILSTCPTNWRLTPQESHDRVRDELFQVYPLGTYKDITKD